MPSFHLLPPKLPLPLSHKKPGHKHGADSGQSLAILAIMFLALLAFVGLAADSGVLYVTYTQLRRGTDAAALAVAAQLREARPQDELERTAEEILRLQGLVPPIHIGIDEFDTANNTDDDGDNCADDPAKLCFRVETCETLYPSSGPITSYTDSRLTEQPALCTFPVRKLVRVVASTSAEMAFMRVWGWQRVRLDASAASEAAALDVMIVMDVSYSMTWDATLTNGFDDDGDGCVDEPTSEVGCATPNGHPDDWLGAKGNDNGLVNGSTTDNAPAGPGSEDGLPDTTPNCNTVAAASTITYLQSQGQLPGNVMGDLDENGSEETPLGPLTPCRPFEYVRDAAIRFVKQYIQFPYDRVGIVTFASAPCPSGRTYTTCSTAWTGVRQSIGDGLSEPDTLKALSIGGTTTYSPVTPLSSLLVSSKPPCHGNDPRKEVLFPNKWYGGQAGSAPGQPLPGAYGECENTDTGDGLRLGYVDLVNNRRSNAVPIIILLSDGAASASANDAATFFTPATYACPNDWLNSGSPYYDPYFLNRVCQDGDSRNFGSLRHTNASNKYDADDYARDQADVISLAGGTIIFTIGLGAEVTNNPGGGVGCAFDIYGTLPNANTGNPDCLPNGEQLLRYIADKGDGINPPDPDPCNRDDSPAPANPALPTAAEMLANPEYSLYLAPIGTTCGNYFYATGGLNVRAVFDEIAQRIFTRLTQ